MTIFQDILHNTKTLSVIAIIIVTTGFAFLWLAPVDDVIKGRVSDLMFLTATYFFGASRTSAKKDDIIAQKDEMIANLNEQKQ